MPIFPLSKRKKSPFTTINNSYLGFAVGKLKVLPNRDLRRLSSGKNASSLIVQSSKPCLLPLAFCLLPFAFCLLPFASCLLPLAFCLLPFASCLLPFAFCLLPFAFCLLPFAFCLLPLAFCLLPLASCLTKPTNGLFQEALSI